VALASIVAAFTTHAPITITPASYDFGEYAINAVAVVSPDFRITLPPSSTPGGTVRVTLAGADVADFGLRGGAACTPSAQGTVCIASVEFKPQSLGPKVARLEVTDANGNRGSAQLKGKGVGALCVHRVVPCNYAPLWTGTFSWTSVLNGPGSQYNETVQVDVVQGVAFCTGGATSSENGRSLTGRITGPALFAVEFLQDPMYPWVYRITVACPTPHWPATEDAAATPSRPAELGHNEYGSERQPAASTAMTLEHLVASLAKLEGSITYPSPDVDPLNGVTGNVTVSWNLRRS